MRVGQKVVLLAGVLLAGLELLNPPYRLTGTVVGGAAERVPHSLVQRSAIWAAPREFVSITGRESPNSADWQHPTYLLTFWVAHRQLASDQLLIELGLTVLITGAIIGGISLWSRKPDAQATG